METFITGTNQKIVNVHPQVEDCDKYGCVIHNPTDHNMTDLPTHLRQSGLIERICEHGIGHPDPDSAAYFARQGHAHMGIHGCDGCCSDEARAVRDAK